MLYFFGKWTVIVFLKIFFRIEIHGQECIPEKGPFILASNHPSYFDPPLIAAVVKPRIYFLAKQELFCNRIAQWFFMTLGAIAVKRQSTDFRALRQAMHVLKDKPLLVFPQGWVQAPLDQVYAGVGFLARKSAVPVIAARITGSETIWPLHKHFFRQATVKVVFSQVRDIQKHDKNAAVAARVMDVIKNL